jgi:hypothetical protein
MNKRKKRPNGSGTISKGYHVLYVKGKRILVHRQVIEKSLNRKLHDYEIVHHINGDKLDNRLENLVVTTRPSHCREHYKLSEQRKNDWKNRIMKIGHKNKIKIQKPRPKPTKVGDIWRNHKQRKAWIVRQCPDCNILFWGRKDHKTTLCLCLKCSAIRANKIKYGKEV